MKHEDLQQQAMLFLSDMFAGKNSFPSQPHIVQAAVSIVLSSPQQISSSQKKENKVSASIALPPA